MAVQLQRIEVLGDFNSYLQTKICNFAVERLARIFMTGDVKELNVEFGKTRNFDSSSFSGVCGRSSASHPPNHGLTSGTLCFRPAAKPLARLGTRGPVAGRWPSQRTSISSSAFRPTLSLNFRQLRFLAFDGVAGASTAHSSISKHNIPPRCLCGCPTPKVSSSPPLNSSGSRIRFRTRAALGARATTRYQGKKMANTMQSRNRSRLLFRRCVPPIPSRTTRARAFNLDDPPPSCRKPLSHDTESLSQ
jgi:hypothetical protein